MAASSTGWSHAAFLSSNGTLFNWNPLGGLTQHSSDPLFTGIATMYASNARDNRTKIATLECTLHPQELFAGLGKKLFRVDLRSRSKFSDGADRAIYTAASGICSVKQHSDPNLFMVRFLLSLHYYYIICFLLGKSQY